MVFPTAALLIAVSSAVKSIFLGRDLLPPMPQNIDNQVNSLVRVYAARFDAIMMNATWGPLGYATAPAFAAFNGAGEVVGIANTDWKKDDDLEILNGDFRDFEIDQKVGPRQAVEYLQIYATGRPICVAGITMRWPNGVGSGFSGDFGRVCGAAWYYSNIDMGDDGYQPSCVWLDSGVRDNTYDFGINCQRMKQRCKEQRGMECPNCDSYDTTPQYQLPSQLRFLPKALQYTVSNFGLRPLVSDNAKAYCSEDSLTLRHLLNTRPDWTYFGVDDVTLFEQGSDLEKRQERQTEWDQDDRTPNHPPNYYITSGFRDHSALQLCTSVTAVGPDFYSEAEKKFCHMNSASGTKKLFDACTSPIEESKLPCWDVEAHKIHLQPDAKKRGLAPTYAYQVQWNEVGKQDVIDIAAQLAAKVLPDIFAGENGDEEELGKRGFFKDVSRPVFAYAGQEIGKLIYEKIDKKKAAKEQAAEEQAAEEKAAQEKAAQENASKNNDTQV